MILNGSNQGRQAVCNLFMSEARNQGESPRLIVGIQYFCQADQLHGIQFRTAFDANGIFNTAAILHMGMIGLPGAIPDPEHVS